MTQESRNFLDEHRQMKTKLRLKMIIIKIYPRLLHKGCFSNSKLKWVLKLPVEWSIFAWHWRTTIVFTIQNSSKFVASHRIQNNFDVNWKICVHNGRSVNRNKKAMSHLLEKCHNIKCNEIRWWFTRIKFNRFSHERKMISYTNPSHSYWSR